LHLSSENENKAKIGGNERFKGQQKITMVTG
jgi:hypothetical protein